MAENIDLKELERKAFRSIFQDGLWDIFFGLLILGLGYAWLGRLTGLPEPFDDLIIVVAWNVGAILVFLFGKRYITVPRMGIVKFGMRSKSRKIKIFGLLCFNLSLTLVVFILTLSGALQQVVIPPLLFSLLIGMVFFTLIFSVVAFILKFNRLYVIGLIGGFSFFLTEVFYPYVGEPLDAVISFSIIGGSVLLMGIVVLIRFLRKYPKPTTEELGQSNPN